VLVIAELLDNEAGSLHQYLSKRQYGLCAFRVAHSVQPAGLEYRKHPIAAALPDAF
jgi:hypothetical protein